LNLFWYKIWYSDHQNPLLIQLGKIVDEFVYSYVVYGIILYRDLFSSKYWWENHEHILKFNDYLKIDKYYRKVTFIHKSLEVNNEYYLRVGLLHVFTSKIKILRYQNWIVINFCYFQPLIRKLKKNINKKRIGLVSYSLRNDNSSNRILKRLKLFNLSIFSFFIKSKNTRNNYLF
jgi:hypothetical protein